MNSTKHSFFITIYMILVKGKKHYIGPSVDALIDLVASRHQHSIHRRWAFQCLHDLQEAGLINRRTRFLEAEDGLYRQIPSLITITLKGAKKLYSLGVVGAEQLTKEIMGWVHRGDKRWPAYTPPASMTADVRPSGGLTKIKDLLSGFT